MIIYSNVYVTLLTSQVVAIVESGQRTRLCHRQRTCQIDTFKWCSHGNPFYLSGIDVSFLLTSQVVTPTGNCASTLKPHRELARPECLILHAIGGS